MNSAGVLSASSVAAVSASVAEQEQEDTSPVAGLAGCDCTAFQQELTEVG